MNYKKSHRDQKVKPYVYKAIENCCNILEIDIHSLFGVIVCGHYPPLFNCTLENYLKRVPDNTIIQLDVKQICLTKAGREIFAERVKKVIAKYRDKITFLSSANDGLFRPETAEYLNLQSWNTWKR